MVDFSSSFPPLRPILEGTSRVVIATTVKVCLHWEVALGFVSSRRPAEDVIMARRLILALLVGLAPLSGCTTCDNPYDDCGPVIDANFHPAGFRSGASRSTAEFSHDPTRQLARRTLSTQTGSYTA